MSDPRRARLDEIRTLLAVVQAPTLQATPMQRQAALVDIAREHAEWLVTTCEALLDDLDDVQAKLDDCEEMRTR